MTYRSILVHLDESPRCEARVALAAVVARAHGAHLMGLAPTGLVALPGSLSQGVDIAAAARAEMNERAGALVARFDRQVAALGLTSFEGRVHGDDSLGAVLQHARCHDLVVLGQNDPKHFTPLVPWDFPQQIFLHAGRPVLMVPYAGQFASAGDKILVAWTESRESARALADALPALRRARQVDVMTVSHPKDAVTPRPEALQGVGQWLARHGVTARLHSDVTEIDVGNALMSRAFDLGADMLVMGGYGHARLTELAMGGVTRSVLTQMTLPVMLSH